MPQSDTFQLVMSRGPQPQQVFELSRGTVSLGRDPGNTVTIDDPQVSRQHARITPQGGLMVLEDLGSTNGTIVNGLRITGPHALAHGDQIGLGDNVTLIFYGRPSSVSGETMVAPRAVTSAPPSPQPERMAPPSAYEAAPPSDYAQDYAAYPEYYKEYEEEEGHNWTLISLGCVLIMIIALLLFAIALYFFAPASVVDPIADFLAGLGINVP